MKLWKHSLTPCTYNPMKTVSRFLTLQRFLASWWIGICFKSSRMEQWLFWSEHLFFIGECMVWNFSCICNQNPMKSWDLKSKEWLFTNFCSFLMLWIINIPVCFSLKTLFTVRIYILTLTLGSLIAKLSDKTTAQFETVITPSESQFFCLKHDGF